MRMTNEQIEKLIANCDRLQRITLNAEGYMHSSCRCFDTCMRAFDREVLPAEEITLSVYLNAPVMKPGEAEIHRDGRMVIRLATH